MFAVSNEKMPSNKSGKMGEMMTGIQCFTRALRKEQIDGFKDIAAIISVVNDDHRSQQQDPNAHALKWPIYFLPCFHRMTISTMYTSLLNKNREKKPITHPFFTSAVCFLLGFFVRQETACKIKWMVEWYFSDRCSREEGAWGGVVGGGVAVIACVDGVRGLNPVCHYSQHYPHIYDELTRPAYVISICSHLRVFRLLDEHPITPGGEDMMYCRNI